MRTMYEAKEVTEELKTVVDAARADEDTFVDRAWNAPPDPSTGSTAALEEAKSPGGGKKGAPAKDAKDKGGAKGGKPAKGGKDAPSASTPVADEEQLFIPTAVTLGNPQIPYLQQAADCLQRGLEAVADVVCARVVLRGCHKDAQPFFFFY